MDIQTIVDNIRELSHQFAQERGARQLRRALVRADFDQLQEAGFLLTGVPVGQGGIWESVQCSVRPVSDVLRILAHGDPSVALVCSMHPTVLSFWLATPEAPLPFREAWAEQRERVFQTAREGAWWGTITSEPGTGGDLAKTRAVARPGGAGADYRLSGQKHFGSGSGITSYMLTSAIPADETEPDWFYLDLREVPWDGSAGVKLLAPWDGQGMIATQSHAFLFEDFPARRLAWPGHLATLAAATGGYIGCSFAAVIRGIVETALEAAHRQLDRRQTTLRAYEQVEWSKAEMEGWLIQQAHEGMLRAVEEQGGTPRAVLQGKIAIAELAESALGRICRVLGGGTYSRQSPFGFWFEDVRALGFLRPPWGLAYDRLFEGSWPSSP